MHHLFGSASKQSLWGQAHAECWVWGPRGGVRPSLCLQGALRLRRPDTEQAVPMWWEGLGPRKVWGLQSLDSPPACRVPVGWVMSGLFSILPPAPSMLSRTEQVLGKYLWNE